ncbi:MAG: hypothetical protein AABY22_04570 [Nanoarchaeota archaeon]
MAKGIIFLILFFLIIIGVILYFYFFYQAPIDKNITSGSFYYNISIRSYEKNIQGEKIPISTEVLILIDNMIYKNITTEEEGFVVERIPINKSFILSNRNFPNQNYYTNKESYKSTESGINLRSEIELIRIGNLSIDLTSAENENIKLLLQSIGVIKNIGFCYRWSPGILTVKSDFEEITPPMRLLGKVDRCYDTQTNLDNSQFELKLSYRKWTSGNETILFTFFDCDFDYNTETCLFENSNHEDVGKEDIQFVVNL